MMTTKEDKMTIDGIEYKLSEISEQCQTEIKSLQFTEAQMTRLTNELAVTETALNAYRASIAQQLPTIDPKH